MEVDFNGAQQGAEIILFPEYPFGALPRQNPINEVPMVGGSVGTSIGVEGSIDNT